MKTTSLISIIAIAMSATSSLATVIPNVNSTSETKVDRPFGVFARDVTTPVSSHDLPTDTDVHFLGRRGLSDTQVLNFALTLELLEKAFYEHSLGRFNEEEFRRAGYPEWVRGRYRQIAEHEKTHVEFLQSALTAAGGECVKACEYRFPEGDVRVFVDTSEALETVGTSAYTGAIQYIDNDAYTTAAASILATEARHTSWINSAVRKQNPWNTAFETPLTFNQVFTLAVNFMKLETCPQSNHELLPPNLHAYPQLILAPRLIPGQEAHISFEHDKLPEHQRLYVAFLSGAATIFAPLNEKEGKYFVEIPRDLRAAGTVFVIVVRGGEKIGGVPIGR